jgi:hypothetical protein
MKRDHYLAIVSILGSIVLAVPSSPPSQDPAPPRHLRVIERAAPCGIADTALASHPGDRVTITHGPSGVYVQLFGAMDAFQYFVVMSPTMPEQPEGFASCLRLDLHGATVVPLVTKSEAAVDTPMTDAERAVYEAMATGRALHVVPTSAIPQGTSLFVQVVGALAFPDGAVYYRGSKVVEARSE